MFWNALKKTNTDCPDKHGKGYSTPNQWLYECDIGSNFSYFEYDVFHFYFNIRFLFDIWH